MIMNTQHQATKALSSMRHVVDGCAYSRTL